MDLLEAMAARHSVRRYLDKPIEQEKVNELLAQMRKGNEEASLHFQLVLNEPEAFKGPLAHYGSFRGVKNYFVAVGPEDRDEAIGYYG
ncbi:MAG: nitroreductase, partial [Oscillospiraceae bacterium]|nr:nitroreductase [Oscillospiraceae bacterium]